MPYQRKLIHLATLLVPILSELTSKVVVLTALCLIASVYALGEISRLKGRPVPLLTPFTLRLSRPDERDRFIIRPLYLAVGVILTLFLFPTNIAYASIGILAVGDPVAAYVGGRFGRNHLRRRKTLEGLVAGFVAAFLVSALIVSPLAAFVGSVGGMLMELLDTPDDNLTMPIAAGALMTLLSLAVR